MSENLPPVALGPRQGEGGSVRRQQAVSTAPRPPSSPVRGRTLQVGRAATGKTRAVPSGQVEEARREIGCWMFMRDRWEGEGERPPSPPLPSSQIDALARERLPR